MSSPAGGGPAWTQAHDPAVQKLVCIFFSKNSMRFCFSSAWRRGRSVVWMAAAPFSKNSLCQR